MLKVANLQYRYPNGAGLGPVNCEFSQGSIYAIVGPNGAGKSTFFSILTGLLRPQNGVLTVDNISGYQRIPLPLLGFLPENSLLNSQFTLRQSLQFDAAMRSQPLNEAELDSRLEIFSCQDFADQKIGSLSQGMAKRAALTLAFQSKAKILVLDEPLNGIDTQTLIQLRHQVLAARRAGKTLLISSHILSFVDEVADEILFLGKGSFVARTQPRYGGAEQIYRQLFLN
ncbi:ABC transporter ATP-binding protein [Mobiluncus sp.]|uniref:ABC transporter ATP-binding protein n=1 Tax=Mobiluncus sp. TaxID=47293 RepID=UPI002A911982|nr:ABC transporter ATP-binding protein [Mobiluncus sp.]MDY6077643.1 ABC transporter ATP-binding protein [Mobiluncus sp.]